MKVARTDAIITVIILATNAIKIILYTLLKIIYKFTYFTHKNKIVYKSAQ